MIKKRLFFLVTTMVIILTNLIGQQEKVLIQIQTDFHPEEIGFIVLNQAGDTLLSDNGVITVEDTLYEWTTDVDVKECIYFEITDSGNNGFDSAKGYYIFYRASRAIGLSNEFYTDKQFHYSGNCGFGQTCETAAPVTFSTMYGPSDKRYWYQYTAERDKTVSISTCNNGYIADTVLFEYSFLDTRIWVYDDCPSRLFDGPEGALTFNENNTFCAPAAGINYIKMKAGQTYYIRLEHNDTTWDDFIIFDIFEIPVVEGCTDTNSCNYNPFANEDDGSCFYADDCLPDLTIGEETFLSSLELGKITVEDECLIQEQCVTGFGERDIIRFSTEIKNIGTADYILGNPESDNSGLFSEENCHEHWHQLGYAEYQLYSGEGQPEPIGFKSGFCVLDINCDDAIEPKYTCDNMGISAGCYDIYDANIDCQWIDVTDVPDGDYTMVARVNWARLPDLRGKREITYDNNMVQVCVNLDRSSGSLEMTILDNCATYSDCFGVENGTAVVDCEGNCGGAAEFGDVNQDTRVNQEDIAFYLDGIKTNDITPTFCTDLSGDARITVYDAALLQQCSVNNDELGVNHAHCNFPRSILNEQQKAIFSIEELNETAGYFDLTYKSPDTELRGFQIKFEGITKITRIENLTDVNFSVNYTTDEQIFALLDRNSFLTNASVSQELLRVYFEKSSDLRPKLQDILEVINLDYQLIASEIEDTPQTEMTPCESLQVSANNQSIELANISLINTKIRYAGPSTNWQDETLCNGDCNTLESIDSLQAGNYVIKVELFNPYCYVEYTIDIVEAANCGQVNLVGGNGQFELSNLPTDAKVEFIGSATNWQNQIVCDGNCPANEIVSIAKAGVYQVKIQTFNPYCYSEKNVTVTDSPNTPDGEGSGDDYCDNLAIRRTQDTLYVGNLTAPINILKIYDDNWQLIYECNQESCLENLSIPVSSDANYHLEFQAFTSDWQMLCTKFFTVGINSSVTSRSAAQLQLSSFLKMQEVVLEWVSNSNWRTDYFEIQQGQDEERFKLAKKVSPKGLEDALIYYRQAAIRPELGSNYYRIKEVYKDGTFNYSNIQTVETAYDPSAIAIAPNPVSNTLYLNLSPLQDKSVRINIVNHLGQSVKIYEVNVLTDHHLAMDLSEVPNGFYLVNIKAKGHAMFSQKLVVERS
ncbi:MAG: lysyl oxidase family protein [Saprospiraceae bacterium]